MSESLLVYVSVPFCRSKCHFCDWVRDTPTAELRSSKSSPLRFNYIQALRSQIYHLGPRLTQQGYVPELLYWGGGTASILDPDEFHAVMEALLDTFDFRNLREATIECSPETLSAEKLQTFVELGFRRISIGVQSLNDRRLRRIGRVHNAAQAAESVSMARAAGFTNINIDLICGFPDETLDEFEGSLSQALTLPANHYSLYSYRPALGTVMYEQLAKGHGSVEVEEQLGAYDLGRRLLTAAGYNEYSLYYFGQPACESDMAYYALRMDWIGFGSGAISVLKSRFLATARGQLHRFVAQPLAFDYDLPASSPYVTSQLLLQSLSTWEGAVDELWRSRTGYPLQELASHPDVAALLDFFRAQGLVEDAQGIRLPREKAAEAFIRLACSTSPESARKTEGNARVGAGR